MKCFNCGAEFSDENRFCPACGTYVNAGQNQPDAQYQQGYQPDTQYLQGYQNQVQPDLQYQQYQQGYQAQAQPNLQYQQGYQEQAQAQPNLQYQQGYQEQADYEPADPEQTEQQPKKSGNRKKKIIIGSIITCAVLAITAVVLILFVFRDRSEAYYVFNGKKFYFSAECGIKDLDKTVGGVDFIFSQRKLVATDVGRLTENGFEMLDNPSDRTQVYVSNSYLGGMFKYIRTTAYHSKDRTIPTSLHGLPFILTGYTDQYLPQFSSENGNILYYDDIYGHRWDVAFVRDGKIISTDYAEEDYNKLIQCYESYGGLTEYYMARDNAIKNGESLISPLMKWCDDPSYSAFLCVGDNLCMNADWQRYNIENFIYNKPAMLAALTRCKLAGEVLSGKISYFVEISHPYSLEQNSPIEMSIYAKDETLNKWLKSYGIPEEKYINYLGEH